MELAERNRVDSESLYEQRARYVCNENGFAFSYPSVPVRQFKAEFDRAVDPGEPTGTILLDASDALGTAYPATTPTLLCRYIRLRAGEHLSQTYAASGEVCYVMSGSGDSSSGTDHFAWKQGDVFCLPGGEETTYRANSDSILFNVTDEPLLAFAGARAPDSGRGAVEAVGCHHAVNEGLHVAAVGINAVGN